MTPLEIRKSANIEFDDNNQPHTSARARPKR